jgi:chemotaxis protein methyltransferase CheR
VALPERLAARAASRSLRLLSAGCASGEEAYSLAMLLKQRGVEPDFQVTVQGVDLNPEALEKASRGVYSAWSMRETPAEMKERWFSRRGRDFVLEPSVRGAVRFDQHNLIVPSPGLIPQASFDIIFCRNVLMYFTTEHAASIVEQLARALAPGGFLFLGHAETLRGLSHAFHLRHSHGAFYYQVRERPFVEQGLAALQRDASATPRPVALPASEWVGTWLETVERSSSRIRQLSGPGTSSRASTEHEASAPSLAHDLDRSLQLLREERFGEALAAMQHLPPEKTADRAALLLRAALLTQQGETQLAEQTCHELIRIDDLNAGAHYLLALCLERRGDGDGAVEQDRIAVYLDPAFAMPHLHLGLMARRKGEVVIARDELGHALSLLEREDEARLLLFGGGFGRSALLSLCRSQLSNLGGAT